MRFLGDVLSEFFAGQGWGRMDVQPLGPAVLALDSGEWAEAMDESLTEFPSCHLSCGLLADFLGRMSQDVVAVMEVRALQSACRTAKPCSISHLMSKYRSQITTVKKCVERAETWRTGSVTASASD